MITKKEEPYEEEHYIEGKKKPKKKIKTGITKDGEEQIIDDENEPTGKKIDRRTGKRIQKKKKIINKDGEIEDVEEIIESDAPTEYDEKTGKKLPKIKKYKIKRGEVIEVEEEPSDEEPSEEIEEKRITKKIVKNLKK
jgi:hypothetical protein